MPFKSKSQQRFLYATDKKLAEKYAKETTSKQMKNLPEKVKEEKPKTKSKPKKKKK